MGKFSGIRYIVYGLKYTSIKILYRFNSFYEKYSPCTLPDGTASPHFKSVNQITLAFTNGTSKY